MMDNSFATFAHAVEIVEIVNSVAGIILNFLLLYAIMKFPVARVLRVGNIHGNVTDTFFDAIWVTAFWIGCQSLPFSLLGIHFLYRFWSVRRPHLIPLFTNKLFVSLLVSITLGGSASWYLLCIHATDSHDSSVAVSLLADEYERKYGKRIVSSWVLMDHWRDSEYDWKLIVITLIMDTQMIISLSSSCTLAVLTFQHIRKSHKMSIQTSELQRKLLVTLCAQAAVPTLCVYLPYVFAINGPFLSIPGSLHHDICSPVLTLFPVWDPVVVILLFPNYRNGLLGIVRKPQPVGPTTILVSTFVHSTAAARAFVAVQSSVE